MERFPAILIGGPPHSGKSVLTYSLTQALRQRGIGHYVMRAAPDGEGDWSNEAPPALVRLLRVKGHFTQDFAEFVCNSVANRHLPLLVDAGGRPTREQERIFDYCTHAVLLTPDEPSLVHWRTRVERHNLPILAELTSHLQGEDRVSDEGTVLRGIITGLERHEHAAGPTFDVLVDRLSTILYFDPDELYRIHENTCPVELVIHLDRLARTFGVPFAGKKPRWAPQHVLAVLDYLPEAVPLALYGHSPAWIYAAVALLAAPTDFCQFDPRLGWVRAKSLQLASLEPEAALQFQYYEGADYVHLAGFLPLAYVDYSELETLGAPPIPPGSGVILSGKLPQWLYTSLALTYRAAPWIAVYQPQIKQAVIVYSADPGRAVGECIQAVQVMGIELPSMIQEQL